MLWALKERISQQLSRLQAAHGKYLDALEDDAQIEEAEEWMDGYFKKATQVLQEIDTKLKVQHERKSDVEHMASNESESNPVPNAPLSSSTTKSTTSAESIESNGPFEATSENSAALKFNAKSCAIDAWIDELIIGSETSLTVDDTSNDLATAIARLEIERDLPKIEIPTFDGSALLWPRFIEQFHVQVHSRYGLQDKRRMDLLQSHVSGDAKTLIEGLGYSGSNYAQALKELKFGFGHRMAVARAHINTITSGNQLPPRDPVALQNFYVAVRDCITTLRQMCYTSEIRSSDVLQRTACRIPPDRRMRWNDFIRNVCRKEEPDLTHLEGWLKDCIESEFNPYAIGQAPTKKPAYASTPTSRPHTSYATSSDQTAQKMSERIDLRKCPLCSGSHHVAKCDSYLNKSIEDRYEIVKSKNLCFNCLYPGHRIGMCKSTVSCKVSGCKSRHHTSLHRSRPPISNQTNTAQVNNVVKSTKVCFQILPVIVNGDNGRSIKTYAMLDSASDITMINDELAQDLGLKGKPETLKLHTLSSPVSLSSKKVGFHVQSYHNPNAKPLRINEAWTRQGSFKCPPIYTYDIQHMPYLQDLGLSDVDPNQVKILIGANVPQAHIQINSLVGHPDEPVAFETQLGWCLMGGISSNSNDSNSATVNFLTSTESDTLLHKQVQQFWSTESFGVSVNLHKPTSVEDVKASNLLETSTRVSEGHYEVPMLWRHPDCSLPNNRRMAEKRFASLSYKLKSDSGLQDKYQAVVNGYVADGYARKLTLEEEHNPTKKTWYLPHHGVVNPRKPDKLRVVFDAAAELDGISLNNQLMSGPDLTNSLFLVLQRFRMRQIALVADIQQMFHQVRLPETDSNALRFLWKPDLSKPGPPEVYKMQVHIFGATDSPCCVNYALQQAAMDTVNDEELQAKQTVLENFYVDDMLKSVDDVKTAVDLVHNITNLLGRKGFTLTKWMSSSKEVLSQIQQTSKSHPELNLDLDNLPVQRTLGVCWDVQNDRFFFNINRKPDVATKRTIVSTVSSVFDPLGFLAPFTFRAKCFIQDLWQEHINWDDVISEELQQKWAEWLNDLPNLSQFQMPRYFGIPAVSAHLELHSFCDASELGFAAVTYLRIENGPDDVSCSFVAAKTHVAPRKQVLTIPKLELQGAVMSTRLVNVLKTEFALDKVVFWTDSMTVLKYIRNETKRWKIFVANRVTEIREHSDPEQWRYVPSKQNPADHATRGLSAEDLSSNSSWLTGPGYLLKPESQWPSQEQVVTVVDDNDENLHRSATTYNIQVSPVKPTFDIQNIIDPHKFSSWNRLLRHTAWIFRAIGKFSRGRLLDAGSDTYLSCNELQNAEVALVRLAQMEGFSKEYVALKGGSSVEERSSIISLDPVFDAQFQVIRVGGRLTSAPDTVECKHQYLLPYDHPVSKLIIHDTHLKLAHAGTEAIIASVRKKFWPMKCRLSAKKIIHQCMHCKRGNVKPAAPMMANLPAQRITPFTRPFTYTGLDYFGPMMVKRARSRKKVWGGIFTCLVTRGVHLELTDSLQTDDFIMMLRCFVGRRGQPKEIFSDNGTQFKGADRELKESLRELDQQKIVGFCSKFSTQWHFIPPHAPHFGGVWERLVGSVKRTLKSILKEQCVTETVLRTSLIEVEAVINSRPLTYNSSSPNDYTALTPNHFLNGGADISQVGSFDPKEIDNRKRWRQSQVLADHLWRRWLKEYLPSLTVRHKWKTDQQNLQVDDLVLLVEDNIPRGQWRLGRVLEVYPSSDNKVRSLKIKTSSGSYVRPATKVCLMEDAVK